MNKNIFLGFLLVLFFTPLSFAETVCEKSPGALVLAHGSDHGGHHLSFSGGHNPWNATVLATVEAARQRLPFPIEVAFGMWDKKAFDTGVKKLAEQGVCELRVIPLFISSHSEMVDVQKYMFGVSDHFELPIAVARVEIPKSIQTVKFNKALDDHEFVSDILVERIAEISLVPSTEGVLFVAHGPYGDVYEHRWLDDLKTHGQRVDEAIRESRNEGFYELSFFTLRDDSPAATRDQRTQELRAKVLALNQKGVTPIVMPVLLARGGIEQGLIERLKGLDYKIQSKFILPHQRMVDWLVNAAH